MEQAGENAMRFPRLAHRSAAAHKLHSTPQQGRMNLISGKGETSSRLPAFSLFLPGSCPNYRDRRTLRPPAPRGRVIRPREFWTAFLCISAELRDCIAILRWGCVLGATFGGAPKLGRPSPAVPFAR